MALADPSTAPAITPTVSNDPTWCRQSHVSSPSRWSAGSGAARRLERLPRSNQATYSAGRKTSVSRVPASSPPIIANAIGPQNTVGAIGIMPNTVDRAVSMIGRKRVLPASRAASNTLLPAVRSASIWPTRITAFLVIMPSRARHPRIATKPSGRPEGRSAATTPIKPKGATLSTMNRSPNLRSSNINTVSMISSMTGTTATTEACDRALSSTVPPASMV